MVEGEGPEGTEAEGVEVEFARWEGDEDRAGDEEAKGDVVFEPRILVFFARCGRTCGWLRG